MTRSFSRIFLWLFAAAVLPAADVTGIWAGQVTSPKGDVQDVAFKFQLSGNTVTGKMFGDEFDLPIEEGSTSGDQIKFVVTTTNYYSGSKVKFFYNGTVQGNEIELSRERAPEPEKKDSDKRDNVKQTFKIKRL
jgi:hypothetical protein